MAKTLEQVLGQINKLQIEADLLRKKEVSGVIQRIQVAISHYGLTSQDLFGDKARGVGSTASAKKGQAPKVKAAGAPKYASGDGRTWTGNGKRPTWFVEALAAGKTAEDLLITAAPAPASTPSTTAGTAQTRIKRARKVSMAPKRAAAPKQAGVAKYQDGNGKTWTGKGKRPAWFVEALAAGKSSEDLLVPVH